MFRKIWFQLAKTVFLLGYLSICVNWGRLKQIKNDCFFLNYSFPYLKENILEFKCEPFSRKFFWIAPGCCQCLHQVYPKHTVVTISFPHTAASPFWASEPSLYSVLDSDGIQIIAAIHRLWVAFSMRCWSLAMILFSCTLVTTWKPVPCSKPRLIQ